MIFQRVLAAIATELIAQIPLVGPILNRVAAEMQRETFDYERLAEMIRRKLLEGGELKRKDEPNLFAALALAEAELELKANRHFRDAAMPVGNNALVRRRFLYLASSEKATAENTYSLAARDGFLVRSLHKTNSASIVNTEKINVNDLIVLCYRDGKNGFRVLLPLLVQDPTFNPSLASRVCVPDVIDFSKCTHLDRDKWSTAEERIRSRSFGPFVSATEAFSSRLLGLNYNDYDPVFNKHTGLNVLPYLSTLEPGRTADVVCRTWKSVSRNAIWDCSELELPEPLMLWVNSL